LAVTVVVAVAFFAVAIIFVLVALVARLFGKDIVSSLQKRMEQKKNQSNDNDES